MIKKYAELIDTKERKNNCIKDFPSEAFSVTYAHILIKLDFEPNMEWINTFNELKYLYTSYMTIDISLKNIDICKEKTIIELPNGLSKNNIDGYRQLVDQINDCIAKVNSKVGK